MKRMKKLLAVLLTVAMVMSMGSMSVMADDESTPNGKIVISNTASNHTYTAYQIFNGTYSDGVLTDVTWGANVDESKLADLLTALDRLFESTTLASGYDAYNKDASAKAVAKALDESSDESDESIAEKFAAIISQSASDSTDSDGYEYLKGEAAGSAGGTGEGYSSESSTYTISGLASGYYYVEDATTDTSTSTGTSSVTDDTTAAYILAVVDENETDPTSVTVTNKSEVPSIKKTVLGDDGETYDETNTASFGDTVTYKLTVTVPNDIADYAEYYLQIVDTLPDGFSFDSITSVTYTPKTSESSTYTISQKESDAATHTGYVLSSSSSPVTITFNNMYELKGTTGEETTETALYDSGNSVDYISGGGTIEVIYTATVASEGTDVTIGDTGNTNTAQVIYSNDPDSNTKGISTETTAKTYVTSITVKKTSDGSTALKGATFTLYQLYGTYNKGTTYGKNTYYYLDSDNEMKSIDSDSGSDSESGTSNLTDGSTALYTEVSTLPSDSTALSTFEFSGLESGTYVLIENTAPSGFKVAGPWQIVVTLKTEEGTDGFSYTIANIAGGVAGTASESTATNATIASSEGKLTVTVTDPSDTFEMPTTGGIGTTIFYVVGAVLVLGAAVILITRRRMRNRV